MKNSQVDHSTEDGTSMTLVPVLGWEESIYGKEFPLGDVELR